MTEPRAEASDEATLASHDGGSGASGTRALVRGEVVGRYVVLDVLGRGGMGVVYAAYDPELDRKVALKLLREDAQTSDARRARMIREAQALARLSHPNVVTVHDVGTFGSTVWLAMEFVEGRTLGGWLAQTPRGWREIVDVLRQAGAGLLAAHRAGLVHRDFKPDNVMVPLDGAARVMDFGLARGKDGDLAEVSEPVSSSGSLSSRLTEAGSIVGTPAYMSPEQLAGAPADARSDQYSFCVTLHEALFGRRPYGARTHHELVAAMLQDDTPTIPALRGVPWWIVRILQRGLARRPEQRFADMHELLTALGRDPRRRRWMAAGLVTATAAAVALVAAAPLQRAALTRACASEATAIDAVWNEAERARLVATTASVERPYAARVGEYAVGVLQEHADAWRSTAEAACRATTIDHTHSVATHELARECLDARRDEIAALLEVYVAPDAAAVRGLEGAVHRLERPEACADGDALARRLALPEGDEARRQVAEIRAELRRVAALTTIGQRERGLASAQDALARAQQTGFVPLIAEAWLQVGRSRQTIGEYEGAEAELAEAFYTAGRVAAYTVMIDAANELVSLLGSRLERRDDAEQWGRLADMVLDAAGERGSLREASSLFRRAAVAYDQGRFTDATDFAERSLAISEELLGPEHPALPDVLRIVASLQLDRGELDAAMTTVRRALAIQEAAFGDQHPTLSATINSLANVHARKHEFPAALELFQRTLQLRIQEHGPEHPSIAVPLANIGAIQVELGDFDAALATFERSQAIYEATPNVNRTLLARCLVNVAQTQLLRGDLQHAIAAAEQALAIFAEADHPDASLALSIVGNAQRLLGHHDAAMAAFQREIEISEHSQESGNGVLGPLLAMARTRLAQGRTAAAVDLLARAEASLQGDDSPETLALLHGAKAEVLWAAGGDRAHAVQLARSALRHYAELGHGYDADRRETEAWLRAHPL